jgi:hypothetical protein
VSASTGSLVGADVREEQRVDDLDRARLQDFYDELERFRAVFARAQALVAPMIGEDASRLEAMGKAIRKLYGGAVEPLMLHVDQVLQQARRMTEPLPENPLHRALERRTGGDRRRSDRAQLGPSFRGPAISPTPTPVPPSVVPLPAPDREADLPTLRTRALPHREIPVATTRPTTAAAMSGRTFEERRAPVRPPEPPRPPSVAPATVPAIRRETVRAPEPELRITFEDPGGWGVL